MQPLVRFTLRHHVLFNLIFVLAMVVGAFSLFTLPVERYPNVEMGELDIRTFYPGASPEEVEALVTTKIEEALEDLEDVEYIRSSSYRQRSSVFIKFVDDSDYQKGYDEARFKVLSMLSDLPAEVDPPVFNAIEVNDWLPVVSVNLLGRRSNQALTLIAKDLKLSLGRLAGVKEVKLRGEQTEEFHVLVDPARMAAQGVTFDQVARAISATGVAYPAGDITTAGGELALKADQRFRSRAQVLATIVKTGPTGSQVRLADVATAARLDYRDPVILASVDGEDCVTLQIIKTPQGNALTILEEVRRTLAGFTPILEREGVRAVLTRDTTVRIGEAMQTLGWNLLLGVALVCLLLAYYLGLRTALITTVGIPFSFLFTMAIMRFTGNSLNEITLFSFVLVSGIIVDDAIVVAENIHRHRQAGHELLPAIVEGVAEVFWPVTAATATTMAAFLPMLIMTGSTGEFFALIPKAVTFALLASLFECFFILPLHFKDWAPGVPPPEPPGEGRGMGPIWRAARWFLTRALNHRWLSLGIAATVFLAAVAVGLVSAAGLAPLIRVKFFPDDYNLYYVEVEAPQGTPIEGAHEIMKELSRALLAQGPGMTESAAAFAGFVISPDYAPIFGPNLGNVAVTLPPKEDRHLADFPENDPLAHLAWVEKQLEPFRQRGLRLNVRAEKDGPPTGKDLSIRVVGTNPAAVEGLAAEVQRYLASDPALSREVVQVADDRGQNERVFSFQVADDRAAEYGLTPREVITLAATALNGRYVSKYRLEDKEIDLKLKLDPTAVPDPAAALTLPLVEHPAGPVRLGDLAAPRLSLENSQLNRYQGQRSLTITGNLRPGSPLSAAAVVRRVAELAAREGHRFPGAVLTFAGDYESTSRSFTSLLYAFAIAILIIYLILAAQFSSYVQPAIILGAVCFALTGVIFGKLVTHSLFTVTSFVATVGVAGVVVNDALVLIDFLNRMKARGLTRREAVYQAVQLRLRPILLTTATTTLGLLPMALGLPRYSLVWGPMASTFVTGLCTATALTVVLVPVMWEMLEGWHERKDAKRAAKAGGEESGEAA
ncbi:MAG: efflux RND transporter permease subunit [Deltaproteobacteria bacterium]|nr:efflux RND transporter permease subunit [Deltaproteobacteria bacterium]